MAGGPGQVVVELTLSKDKLRRQIREAASDIKQGLKEATGPTDAWGTPLGVPKVSDSDRLARAEYLRQQRRQGLRGYNVQEWARQHRQVRRAMDESTARGEPWRMPPDVGLGTSAWTDPGGGQQAAPAAGGAAGTGVPPVLGASGSGAGGRGGGGGWSRYFGGRASGGFFAGGFGKALGNLGLVAAAVSGALAGLRVVIGLVRYAFSLMMAPVRNLTKDFMQQAEEARGRYAKALMSGGLPLGFVTHRENLARILGVSEKDVLMFAEAIQTVGWRVREASEAAAKATPVLAGVAWEWRAMQANMAGAKAQAAETAAPFAKGLMTLANIFGAGAIKVDFFGRAVRAVTDFMGKTILGTAGPAARGLVGWTERLGRMVAAPPQPETWARRLPVSQWERMGMVLGGDFAASTPAQETAKNTKKSASILQEMLSLIKGPGPGKPESPIMNRP